MSVFGNVFGAAEVVGAGGGLGDDDRAKLAAIFDRTSGGRLVARNASPGAADGGTITLVRGDDYTAAGADGDPVCTHTLASAVAFPASAVVGAFISIRDEQSGEEVATWTGGVSSSSVDVEGVATPTLKFTADAASSSDTELLRKGRNTARYTVVATLVGGLTKTLARGDVDVE